MNIVSEMLKKGTKNRTLEEINTLLFGIEPMNIFKSIRIQTSRLDQPLIYLRSNYGIVLTLFNSVDRIMGSFCSRLVTLLKVFSNVLMS